MRVRWFFKKTYYAPCWECPSAVFVFLWEANEEECAMSTHERLNVGNFDVIVYGPIEGNKIATSEGLGVISKKSHESGWVLFGIQADYGPHLAKQENGKFGITNGEEMEEIIETIQNWLREEHGGTTRHERFSLYVYMPPQSTLKDVAVTVGEIIANHKKE